LAFALGVTAGALIRRTLPAMAVTLAIFAALQVAMPLWIRPSLAPPLSSGPVNAAGQATSTTPAACASVGNAGVSAGAPVNSGTPATGTSAGTPSS
jgi:hypothetical protein